MTLTYGILQVGDFGLLGPTTPVGVPDFPLQVDNVSYFAGTDPTFGQRVARRTQSSASRNTSRYATQFWRIRGSMFTSEEKDAILDSFNTGGGQTRPLTWLPCDEAQTLPVRFASNELTITKVSADTWQIDFDIEEVM